MLSNGSDLPSFLSFSMDSKFGNKIEVYTDSNDNVGYYDITIRVENDTGDYYDNNFTLEV